MFPHEWQLLEVVVLESQYAIPTTTGLTTYVQKLLQRINDLIRLDVPEDVNDFTMLGCLLWINNISKGIRRARRDDVLSVGRRLRLGNNDGG